MMRRGQGATHLALRTRQGAWGYLGHQNNEVKFKQYRDHCIMACFLTAPDGFVDLLRASEKNLWTYLMTVSVSDCMVSNGVRIHEQ
jgi:hypothetical protein